MADRNTVDLDPEFLPKVNELLELANSLGAAAEPPWCVKVIVTWRDAEDQVKAHECGLSAAGAGQSPHNCTTPSGLPASRAIDFGVFEANGVYVTKGLDPRYQRVGSMAEGIGLVWGGCWLHPDYDHVELPNWKTAAPSPDAQSSPSA